MVTSSWSCTLLVAESVAAPLPPPQNHPDTSQEAVVFEQIHELVRFENDGSGTRENTTVVRVQSTAGVQELGQLVLRYSSATEDIHRSSMSVFANPTAKWWKPLRLRLKTLRPRF